MSVLMELSKIVIHEMQDQQRIELKEVNGPRRFTILIGDPEAKAIERRLKGTIPPRPMTHDLLATVIDRLGGKLEKIEITELKHHTFFSRLSIRLADRVVEVDSRPSDAIALGIADMVPIYVAEQVLIEEAKKTPDGL